MAHKMRKNAIHSGMIDGHDYFIVPGPYEGLNGYVVFKKRPVREQGYDGILAYVPVHGGITYASEDGGEMVYGFDTAHSDSDKFPRNNKEWIRGQCEIMLKGILRATEVEHKYLACLTNKGKAKHAQYVRDVAPNTDLGFGAMINLLSGQL